MFINEQYNLNYNVGYRYGKHNITYQHGNKAKRYMRDLYVFVSVGVCITVSIKPKTTDSVYYKAFYVYPENVGFKLLLFFKLNLPKVYFFVIYQNKQIHFLPNLHKQETLIIFAKCCNKLCMKHC